MEITDVYVTTTDEIVFFWMGNGPVNLKKRTRLHWQVPAQPRLLFKIGKGRFKSGTLELNHSLQELMRCGLWRG